MGWGQSGHHISSNCTAPLALLTLAWRVEEMLGCNGKAGVPYFFLVCGRNEILVKQIALDPAVYLSLWMNKYEKILFYDCLFALTGWHNSLRDI